MGGNSTLLATASKQYFSSSGNASLNRQKFTIAFWAKRNTTQYAQYVYYNTNNPVTTEFVCYFLNAGGPFGVFDYSGSYDLLLTTNTYYGDTTNWHHYCIAIDTTQATASNRAKFYFDGVQVTSFSSATYPSQNYNLHNNNTTLGLAGYPISPSADAQLDGYLAEFYYIDGQQLDPTYFGQTVGGGFYETAYTGTYTGVFDFYLNFSNSGSLGADSSGEGNNWTPQNSPTQSTKFPPQANLQATFGAVGKMGLPIAWQISSVFSGTGSLSATAVLGLTSLVAFSGTGSFSATAGLALSDSAIFSGGASLAYSGALGLVAGAIFNNNSPSLSAIGAIGGMVTAILTGAGLINAYAVDVPPGGFIAIFNGAGLLVAGGQQLSSAYATFSGGGSLTPTVFLDLVASAVFHGNGAMLLPLSGASTFNGMGSFSANTIWRPRAGFFIGFGGLSVNAIRYVNINDQFNGKGRVCVQATVREGRRGPISNVVKVGPGVSANVMVGGGV